MTARDMFKLVDVTVEEIGYEANYDPAAHGGAREGNDQLFVHHPGADYGEAVDSGEDPEAERDALRKIEAYAMRNGWWGIAYDVCVGMSGLIYAGRGLARSGATSGDVDDDGTHNNDEGEAVLFLVSPDGLLTPAAKRAGVRLFDAHGGKVIGHKNAGGIITSCPGPDRLRFIGDYVAGDLDLDEPKPAPTPKPKTSWTEELVENLPLLKKRDDLGRASDDDRRLQGLLVAAGVLDLAPNLDGNRLDGKFGSSTLSAVRTFQSRAGLRVDGLVGRKTWTALLGG